MYVEDWHPPQKGWVPFSSYLVSWVPPEQVDKVWVDDPESRVRWLADADCALAARLRQAGLPT